MHGGVETAGVLEADCEVTMLIFYSPVAANNRFYDHRSTAACVSLHAWSETQFWHGYMATYIYLSSLLLIILYIMHCYTFKKYSTVILAGLALIIRK